VKASYKLGEALKKPKKAAKKPAAKKPAAKKPAVKKTPKKKAEGECSSAAYGVTALLGCRSSQGSATTCTWGGVLLHALLHHYSMLWLGAKGQR
jgi:hypothetical protein